MLVPAAPPHSCSALYRRPAVPRTTSPISPSTSRSRTSSTPKRAALLVRPPLPLLDTSTTATPTLPCWPSACSISASRTADTPSICRSALKNFSMSLSGGFRNGPRFGRPVCRPRYSRRLKSGEERYARRVDTREDLGFIRDMHRLLSYKGYVFPEVRREDAAVLNPSDNLKSAEEMEEEEREAQSAKLQELIRRGTPEDLQEANRLMKIMAGYDTRSKTDYRAKAAEEVGKIQAKARLLEERLEAFQEGDKMQEGDVFSELAAALQSAQPKIQKMCEEESDDHEAVAKLLEINDSIHRTVERYKLMKKGDLAGAAKVAAGAPPPSTSGAAAASSSAANELSLIDFDGDASNGNGAQSSSTPAPASGAAGIENDLLGLDIGGDSGSFGQGGGIALGFGANQNIPRPCSALFPYPGQLGKGSCVNTNSSPFLAIRLLLTARVPVSYTTALSISAVCPRASAPARL
ncbi:ARF-binding protein [Fusarium falciforme]|nr:ARF-binding protein [Fusarium falciforme]